MSALEHVHDLLPGYVLGAADAAEAETVERHLEECPECEAELRGWSGVLEALAESAPAVEPSELARARLARELAASSPAAAPAATPRRAWWQAVAAGIAALAILWGGFEIAGLRTELAEVTTSNARLADELRRSETQLAASRAELARVRLAFEVIGAQRASGVVLAGLEPAPQAWGHAYVDPASARAAFVVAGLAPAPEGRTYQLWKIVGGAPVSAGVFDVDADGRATVLVEGVEEPAEIDLWAVTEEPEGGVAQPTGAMVLRS